MLASSLLARRLRWRCPVVERLYQGFWQLGFSVQGFGGSGCMGLVGPFKGYLYRDYLIYIYRILNTNHKKELLQLMI